MTIGALACLLGVTPALHAEQLNQKAPAETATTTTPAASELPNAQTEKRASDRPSANSTASSAINEEIKDLTWINQQPSSNYTLQLMVAATPKPLLAFTRKERLSGPLAMAVFKRDGKILHLLVQGSYSSFSDAENAAVSVEQETGVKPWVRKFSSLPELFDGNSQPPRQIEARKQALQVEGAAWLWSRNPTHYTIQWMGDRQIDSLRAVVAEHRPAAPVAIVRVIRKGKPWYLLLTGDYPSQEEAVSAINALPERMSLKGPWPRRFASLQDEMAAGNH